jgi:L-rhamnose mutarotase
MNQVQKMGMCINLDKNKVDKYKQLHKNCPREIRELLREVSITNFSIFLKEPENLLFSYWEYTGSDFDKDMKIMSENEVNKKWWKLCGPCQIPFENGKKGEWWANMESVFYNK